jgi:acetolactate synthase I/II/III large subunit
MQGLEAVGALLERQRTGVVFGLLGATNVGWAAAGVGAGRFRLVSTRHEETSVCAAAGYARASGGVGVCTVTRGPGFANAFNAMVAAASTHVPVVLIVGESPSPNPATAQNLDQELLTRIIGARFRHAAATADLPAVFEQAFAEARHRGLAQVLSIADDALSGELQEDSPVAAPPYRPDPVDPAAIQAAVDLLVAANAPLVIAGHGAVIADCRKQVWRLVDVLGANGATSLLANRYFDGHPHDLGVSGGWSPPLAHRLLRDHDVVLGLGASLNRFTLDQGRLYPDARIIQCDIAEEVPDTFRVPDVRVVGDAREVAEALLAELAERGRTIADAAQRAPRLDEIRRSLLEVPLNGSGEGLDLREVYRCFDRALPPDRIVVTDSGRTCAPTVSMVGATGPREWLIGRGWGSIGLGIGTAIGVATARPDHRVVLFSGDGGFMLASQELDTARRAGIDNLTVVVMNDEQFGSEVKYLKKLRMPTDIVHHSTPDLAALARVYGGDGAVVRRLEDIETLPENPTGLFVVDVRLDPLIDVHLALGDVESKRDEAPAR